MPNVIGPDFKFNFKVAPGSSVTERNNIKKTPQTRKRIADDLLQPQPKHSNLPILQHCSTQDRATRGSRQLHWFGHVASLVSARRVVYFSLRSGGVRSSLALHAIAPPIFKPHDPGATVVGTDTLPGSLGEGSQAFSPNALKGRPWRALLGGWPSGASS
jgi:hypothetical protein